MKNKNVFVIGGSRGVGPRIVEAGIRNRARMRHDIERQYVAFLQESAANLVKRR